MGIRMLHRRTAQARTTARAAAAAGPVPRPPLVLALAADASTARIHTDLATTVRTAMTDLGRRLTHHLSRLSRAGLAAACHRGADLVRGYLALLLAALPSPRPPRTITVFVATVIEPPAGSTPHRPRREQRDQRHRRHRQEPGPDATP
ncbi:hypothetical protein [Streptomyces sp. NPDC046805]|uniref:hypothetical protein n=1 Tax=Streptomyces sp. NPDC046805 TaxID=3155134 RepID=UPI0033C861E2